MHLSQCFDTASRPPSRSCAVVGAIFVIVFGAECTCDARQPSPWDLDSAVVDEGTSEVTTTNNGERSDAEDIYDEDVQVGTEAGVDGRSTDCAPSPPFSSQSPEAGWRMRGGGPRNRSFASKPLPWLPAVSGRHRTENFDGVVGHLRADARGRIYYVTSQSGLLVRLEPDLMAGEALNFNSPIEIRFPSLVSLSRESTIFSLGRRTADSTDVLFVHGTTGAWHRSLSGEVGRGTYILPTPNRGGGAFVWSMGQLMYVDRNGNPIWREPVPKGQDFRLLNGPGEFVFAYTNTRWTVHPESIQVLGLGGRGEMCWSKRLLESDSGEDRCILSTDGAVGPHGRLFLRVNFHEPCEDEFESRKQLLVAVEPDGSTEWSRRVEYPVLFEQTPAIGPEGDLYVRNRKENNIVRISGDTGSTVSEIDTFDSGARLQQRLIVGPNGRIAYVSNAGMKRRDDDNPHIVWGELSIIDPKTGDSEQLRFQAEFDNEHLRSGIVGGLAAGGPNGELYVSLQGSLGRRGTTEAVILEISEPAE